MSGMAERADQEALLKRRLARALESGRLPHALFFAGLMGARAQEWLHAAAGLWCGKEPETNPDCLFLREAGVEHVRDLRKELGKRPYYEGRRAVVIQDIHKLNEASQNALLKTLEDPPRDVLFLLSGLEAGVLPTVFSRCAVLRFGPAATEGIAAALEREGIPAREAGLYAAVSGGDPGLARELASDEGLRALRAQAHGMVLDLAKGKPPFERARELSKGNRDQLAFALGAMLSLLGDAQRAGAGADHRENPDCARGASELARRFTHRAIQGMIEAVQRTLGRLDAGVVPGRAMDYLAAELTRYLEAK